KASAPSRLRGSGSPRASAMARSPSRSSSSSGSLRPTAPCPEPVAPPPEIEGGLVTTDTRVGPVAATGLRPRQGLRTRAEARAGYLFLLPWLVGFFVLTVGPMIASLYLSFTDYDLFGAPEFIGAENYQNLFADPRFRKSAQVTGLYVVLGVPVKLAAALAVAMLLNAKRKGLGFYRSAFYAPSLVAVSVSIAIVWRAMFMDDGAVDRALSVFGIHL